MEGNVKWFNRTKGYGFIEGDDGKEYFVHSTYLGEGKFLRDNDRVSFEPAESDKGPQAKDVNLLQKGSEREDVAQEAPAEEAAEEAPAEEAAEEAPAEEAAEEAPAEEAPAEEAAEEVAEEAPAEEPAAEEEKQE